MVNRFVRKSLFWFWLAVTSLCAITAHAADFYNGKTVTIVVAFGAGGGYGIYSQTLAKYMPAHIPGRPNMIIQYMPGAGGAKAANYLFNVAPKDGTVIGMLSSTTALFQTLGGTVKYDAAAFNYVGRITSLNTIVMVWHTAPATSIESAKKNSLIFGAPGKASNNYMEPTLIGNLLGLKFKVVTGYPGGKAINLAMERGEVHGRVGSWDTWKSEYAHWLGDKKIIPLAEFGLEKIANLPNVPFVMDLVKAPEDRAALRLLASSSAIGRSMSAPPGILASELTTLRQAFDETMRDEGFVGAANKRGMVITPMEGSQLQSIVDQTINTPRAVVERVKTLLER